MSYSRYFLALAANFVIYGCDRPVTDSREDVQSDSTIATTVALTDEQIQSEGIQLGKIEMRQISGTVKANGVLDVPPQQLISISSPMAGFLKNTELLQGSRVKKGQVVAVIENLDFIQMQQDYLDAKSHYEFAKADYERQQQLAKEEVNSEKTIQQSRSNYLSWQAKYNGLKEKLNVLKINAGAVEDGKFSSTIQIFSPIEGYVTQVNVNIGRFVNTTDVLFEIVDTEHLHVELTVFEKDVPKLRLGQKVRFTLANESTERLATVYLIGRQISSERTVRVHCHIEKEDRDLLPGMFLSALVETGGENVPALADEAIIPFQGNKYVFVADDQKHNSFTMVQVQTGQSESGFTSLASLAPLTANSHVVVKGGYELLSVLKNKEEE